MGTDATINLNLSEAAFDAAYPEHTAKKNNRNAAGQFIGALPLSDIRNAHTAEWADWVDDFLRALTLRDSAAAQDPIAEYTIDFATLANETLADAQVDVLNSIAWTVTVATGDDLAYVNGSGMVATITDTNTAHDGNSGAGGATATKIETTFANLYAALSASSGVTIDCRNKLELFVRYASPPTDDNTQIVGISDRGISGSPLSTSGRMAAAGFVHDGTRQNAMVIGDTSRDQYYPHDNHDTAGLILGDGSPTGVFAIHGADLDATNFDGIMHVQQSTLTAQPIKLPENLLGLFFQGTAASSYVATVRSATFRAYR